ncbi:MAG: TolC family protein [Chryseolinea sp.]
MNKFLCVVLLACVFRAQAQSTFTIDDVVQKAQSQSTRYKVAETQRETAYWDYRYYRTNYNPQVRLTNSGNQLYTNSFSRIQQPDGTIQYLQINQFNPGINIGLEQPIQWTNTTISANTGYNYFRDYKDQFHQWNGQVFNLRLSQPVFSFNKLKWDRLIAPIKYEESKRQYAQDMQQIAHDAVFYFFGVLRAQVDLQISQYNVANNDTIFKIEQGRYNIGTTSQDKLLQVELQLLRSRQAVAQARMDLSQNSLYLRSYMGLKNGEEFQLVLPGNVPAFEVTEDEAFQHAKETRAEYIAFDRRRTEADMNVARTKGNYYNVQLDGGFGVNNVGATVGDLYKSPARQQYVQLGFNIPIIDWGRRHALVQSANASKRLTDYQIEQEQITFEQQVFTQVRQFETLRLQIEITRKADEVAFERYNVAQNRYLIGKIDITNLNIALNEKDDAKRGYLTALQDFWIAYFELRRLTLYDFSERKYLYNPFVKE